MSEKHPAGWPFPTYKGQPYKPPTVPRTPKPPIPDLGPALF